MPRRLRPPGVVHPGHRLSLRACLRRKPAVVEDHEHRVDPDAPGELEESVHARLHAFGIGLPDEVVEEHAHAVHPDLGRPTQLALDRLRIPGLRLPHLELVRGGARGEVAAHEPRLFRVPLVRAFFAPPIQRHDALPSSTNAPSHATSSSRATPDGARTPSDYRLRAASLARERDIRSRRARSTRSGNPSREARTHRSARPRSCRCRPRA